MPVTINKVCKDCGESKPVTEFRKNAKTRDGLKHECKSCDSLRAAAYYEANKRKRLQQIGEWQEENKDKKKQYNKTYHDKGKTK